MKYKRSLDLFIVFIAHIFPPFPLIWLMIWIIVPVAIWVQDRGPIFYTQERIGENGRIFLIRKFRTMVPNAEATTGAIWSHKNDPRITKVGNLLRWTALDELPQILNIIKGDMSFVGPRSERPVLHKLIVEGIPEFEKRLKIKPGLTGLKKIQTEKHLNKKFDEYYALNYSLFFDLEIMIKTILKF